MANVLQIGYAPQETISRADFTNVLRTPVLNWLANNPTKRPKYWVLFLDVPSRIYEVTNVGHYPTDYTIQVLGYAPDSSVSYALSILPEAKSPLITHINMGSTNHIADTNACRAYIDKLAYFGVNYSPGKTVISASAGGYDNSKYFFEERGPSAFLEGACARDGVIAQGVASTNIVYRTGTQAIGLGTNVAGYISPGIHNAWPSSYASDGSSVLFTGNSSWFLMTTVESFNGQRYAEMVGQGCYINWFCSAAFGGTNFSNTPVGAIGYTEEPYSSRNHSGVFFGNWAAGKRFGSAAWNARDVTGFIVIGDPLIKK